jgi:hypothetical protein
LTVETARLRGCGVKPLRLAQKPTEAHPQHYTAELYLE